MDHRIIKYFLVIIISMFLITLGRTEVVAADYNLGEVIVTATKTEKYQSQVGSSTTVMTRTDIEKFGKQTVMQLLEDVPGVSLTPTGYFGGAASVDIRGGKRGQTLVMIDGVEVYDPIGVSKDFDFANLTNNNIERIEIVRGPQSALYGSDAMAGVINIITKKGEADPRVEVSAEAGSHRTFAESLAFSGKKDRYDFSAELSQLTSDGISKARDGADDDGYKNLSFSSRVGMDITENLKADLVVRNINAEFDADDGAYEDDPNRKNEWRMSTAKAGLEHKAADNWTQVMELSGISFDRIDSDPADSVDTTEAEYSRFRGDRKKLEWRHNVSLFDFDKYTLGYEYEEERGASYAQGAFWWSNAQSDRREVLNRAYYLNSEYELADDLFLGAGIRTDNHSIFGNATNYQLNAAYILEPTLTRFKSSFGTAFRAPNLYQIYDATYGNRNLSPEKSQGFDLGFEQLCFEDRLFFGLTYFQNKYRNLIDSDPVTWQYVNIKKGTSRGYEFESKYKVTENIRLGGNYTYTKTRDKANGREFGRRAKNQAAGFLDWDVTKKANVYFGGRYVGARLDSPSYNDYKNKRYVVCDVSGSYDLSEDVEFFARAENIFDRAYEPIRGYNGLERAVSAGLKGRF